MPTLTVIYDARQETRFNDEVLPHLPADGHAELLAWDGEAPLNLPARGAIWCWLGAEALRRLLPDAAARERPLGLLPHPDTGPARAALKIPDTLEAAITLLCDSDATARADLFYCNDQLVFNAVSIGDPASLMPKTAHGEHFLNRWRRFVRLFRGLGKIRLRPYTFTTEKDKSLETAALGMVAVNRSEASAFARRTLDDSSSSERQLSLLILSPRSVMEVLRFLLATILMPFANLSRLPEYLGMIRSRVLTIESPQPVLYTIDGLRQGKESTIELRVEPGALSLLGAAAVPDTAQGQEKEAWRVQGLPTGESRRELLTHTLPWIHHASSDDFKELFLALKDNARSSESYLTLMVLSTLLATLGLFANSGPVIIGAMILAPLMSPIISLSMGVLRQYNPLIIESGRTLALGVGLSLLFATVMTWLTPLQSLNEQISARLSPTLLDLGVAIVSGIAGAYAHARAEVAKSLAGVAIAVALVPPLAVAGIGIGWFDLSVFWGAFLLFVTNLIGIVLAAALTFLVLGFSAFRLARKGLAISLAIVLLVSVPLGISFVRLVDENRIVSQLEGQQIAGIELQDVRARPGQPLKLSMRLLAEQTVTPEQIGLIKQTIEAQLGQPVRMDATLAISR